MSAAQQKRISEGNYIQPEHSKPVIKCDLLGNELEKFKSMAAAAKAMNCERKNFQHKIKKSKRGYYKGFIWKFA